MNIHWRFSFFLFSPSPSCSFWLLIYVCLNVDSPTSGHDSSQSSLRKPAIRLYYHKRGPQLQHSAYHIMGRKKGKRGHLQGLLVNSIKLHKNDAFRLYLLTNCWWKLTRKYILHSRTKVSRHGGNNRMHSYCHTIEIQCVTMTI